MKLRDLNNLLVRGRARIWTWICLTPNPVCFTPQRATNLGGDRHGALGETERDELLEAMFRGSHALRAGWHQAGRPPLPWQPAEQLRNSSHESRTVSSLSGKKKQPGSCSPNLTRRENCLVLCHRKHRRKLNQEGRACGAWN